jgi:mono/diheme cytochrome c family protein
MARSRGRGIRPGRNLGVGVMLACIGIILGISAVWNASQRSNSGAGAGDQIALGQRVYAAQCASCHGANLEGQPNWQSELAGGGRLAPPHDVSGHTWHHPDQQLFEITKYGGQRFSSPDYKNNMPGFEGRLSDDEIRAVLAYIKSSWPPDIQAAQAQAGR